MSIADETHPDREALATAPWSCITDHVTFPGCGRCGPCRQALAAGWAALALPAPHPQGGTEALRAQIEAETHREVDAPAGTDFGYRVGWADGYTAACGAVRALLAAEGEQQ